MCGIIGYWPITPEPQAKDAFTRLFEESIVRGMHAYGIAQPYYNDNIAYIRTLKRTEVQSAFDPKVPAIAHARYSQSGDWRNMENNQPIVVGGRALAHNGVIHMGTKEEFEAVYGVECQADNDSEIFLRATQCSTCGKLRNENDLCSNGFHVANGVTPVEFITDLKGSFAGVWLEGDQLWAGRNARRPLWKTYAFGALWYASTADIFKRAGFVGATEVPLGVQHAATGVRMEIV